MDTKRTDVGTRLAANPEDTEVSVVVEGNQLALMDGPDTQLSLDCRNQRRPLEQGSREGLQGLREGSLAAGDGIVEADDCDVFFAGSLLRLDKAGSPVNANNETSRDLGIECTAVTRLLDAVNKIIILAPQLYQSQWEPYSYRSMRFTHATTSWLDGLDGLSRLITPLEM